MIADAVGTRGRGGYIWARECLLDRMFPASSAPGGREPRRVGPCACDDRAQGLLAGARTLGRAALFQKRGALTRASAHVIPSARAVSHTDDWTVVPPGVVS